MKIFLVALMAFMENGQVPGFEPPMAYVFTDPTFNSVPECKNFAIKNSDMILFKLYKEFGQNYRPHMISCVDKNVVDKIKNTSRDYGKELDT
tara:strand:+ start:140 stop:415 length:276 start_codon:yes stop_codon:yes gene_type:complete